MKEYFENAFDDLSKEVLEISKEHGWIKPDKNDGEAIALMHSELSEALEWLRNGNGESDHIKEFSGVEEELADVVIRIMEYSQYKSLDISGAILAKIEFNKSRPFKHGGKKF